MKDIEKVEKNQHPDYLITGQFMTEDYDYRRDSSTDKVFISYKTTGIQTTVVSLEMNADNLKFISTIAKGIILRATIRLDGFEAMSGSGFIDYKVMNEDNFDSNFYVELANCSNEVLPAPAQKISIAGLKIFSSFIKVQTTKTLALNYTCDVILKNSEGTQIDVKQVGFSTIAQQNYTVDQGNTAADVPTTPAEQEWTDKGGCSSCSGLFSLFCMLSNFCILETIITIIVVIAVIIVIVITCKYCRGCYKYLF